MQTYTLMHARTHTFMQCITACMHTHTYTHTQYRDKKSIAKSFKNSSNIQKLCKRNHFLPLLSTLAFTSFHFLHHFKCFPKENIDFLDIFIFVLCNFFATPPTILFSTFSNAFNEISITFLMVSLSLVVLLQIFYVFIYFTNEFVLKTAKISHRN